MSNDKGQDKKRVAVMGAGSWGTALSLLLYKNGNQVTVWSALENEIQMLKEERELVLPVLSDMPVCLLRSG